MLRVFDLDVGLLEARSPPPIRLRPVTPFLRAQHIPWKTSTFPTCFLVVVVSLSSPFAPLHIPPGNLGGRLRIRLRRGPRLCRPEHGDPILHEPRGTIAGGIRSGDRCCIIAAPHGTANDAQARQITPLLPGFGVRSSSIISWLRLVGSAACLSGSGAIGSRYLWHHVGQPMSGRCRAVELGTPSICRPQIPLPFRPPGSPLDLLPTA